MRYLVVVAASLLALAGCMGPTGVVANGRPVYVNNCLIKTMCLDVPANRPCPDEQCVEMRQAAIMQFMATQQRTYEAQMRAMQPLQPPHQYVCRPVPGGTLVCN